MSQNQTSESLEQRGKEENLTQNLNHSFSVHKPFYILPLSYNFSPNKKNINDLSQVDNMEVKFQFSFKFDIIEYFFFEDLKLAFAYTNLSFWQLYNPEESSPFRETNHEPELFLVYRPHLNSPSHKNNIYRFGFSHQSNGQNVPLSRSWNRVYLQGIFNITSMIVAIKTWQRIHEQGKGSPLSPEGDDNPDINEYMGHFELNIIKKYDGHTISLLWRNNLRKENRGAIEINWSFPLNSKFKGYFQYFNGYGESLIDYNSPIERVGLGILMGDWI